MQLSDDDNGYNNSSVVSEKVYSPITKDAIMHPVVPIDAIVRPAVYISYEFENMEIAFPTVLTPVDKIREILRPNL